MSSVVGAESPYIVEAIQESMPNGIIQAACNRDYKDLAFSANHGGIIGGDVFNIITAIANQRQRTPDGPLSEKPVRLPFIPQGFVSKLAINMLNQTHTPIKKDALPPIPSFRKRKPHFCNQSEYFYNRDAAGEAYLKQELPPQVVFNEKKRIALYRKGNGHASAKVMQREGINWSGIWLPPGFIGFYEARPNTKTVSHGDFTYLKLNDILRFAGSRLSAFAIPEAERTDSLLPAVPSRKASGLPESQYPDYPSIDDFRWTMTIRTLNPYVAQQLNPAEPTTLQASAATLN